jgi:hypothetical protein
MKRRNFLMSVIGGLAATLIPFPEIEMSDTILPPEVYGPLGINGPSWDNPYDGHWSNITVSVDMARSEINELGKRGPYSRTVNFP